MYPTQAGSSYVNIGTEEDPIWSQESDRRPLWLQDQAIDWRQRFADVPEEPPTIGVDRGHEMVDVPPIPFFPEWESKYLPRQRMTQREAGRRAHEKQKNFDAAMAGYMRQQAALGAGRGYQDLGATGLLGVTTPADMIDLTTLGAQIPILVKAAGATSIGRFLRQLAADETSGAVFRNMPDAQIDDLAVQIADQHADVSRQAWNTSTARGAADIARGRMSARAGQELPGPGLDRYDPAVMGPDAWRKPTIGQLNPEWPPARSQRESFLLARLADMEATGVKGVDPETVNQILRQETSAAQVEADLYRYLDGLWEAHVEEVATASGLPRAEREARSYVSPADRPVEWQPGDEALLDAPRPWPPETPEDFARVEREMEAARLRQQREEMEIDRAIERQDPLYESDPGPARDPGMPDYDPNWTPNPDWEARWIAHNPRDYAARKALAEEGYALGYGDADLQSMDPGAEWSNMAGERIPNPNTGRIDYFTDPDAVMPNLAGNRPASIPDAREIPPWRDVGPPSDPTAPQPDILPNPIGGRRPSVAPRRPRLPPQVEEGTYAWQFDPEWDDLLREYPTQVMQEGIDDIVLQYQRDLEMGNTPTYKEDFMLLGDRAEGVVPVDDLNNWGGVLDEQIAMVDEELAAIASGDLSNPAHPDYYFPGENMTGRDMSEWEAFANRPPFTAKELRQRRLNYEEGEADLAILEEGGRTDPPMPPTDPAAGFAEPITELPTSVHEEMAAKARQQGFDPDAPAPKSDDIPSEEKLFEDYLKQVEDTSLDPKPPVTAPPPGRGWSDDPIIHEWLREEGFSPQMPFYLADEAYELVPIARRQELMETMNQMTDDEVAFGLPRLLEVIDELKQAEANGADVSQAMAETMYKLNRAIQRFGPSRSKLMIEADAAGLMPAHAYRDMHARIRKGFDEDTVSRLDKVLGNPADFTPEDYSVLLERSKELSRAGDHEGAEHLLQVLRAWAEGDVNMLTHLSE
tara:strand:- start:560 stop:3496 length:2937 start_codon:yes stop_codon:yes gene_type:complete